MKLTTLLIAAFLSVANIQPALAEENKQVQCIAESIYHEANNQPLNGKIAVANVIMNRVNSGKFPTTPCGVVNQKYGNKCQFSWVCTKSRIKDIKSYKNALNIAELVYSGSNDVTNGAIYFHLRKLHPSWSKRLQITVVIADHVFLRG
jgi:spore germination cell wall hydrolase CwlJ-like protein